MNQNVYIKWCALEFFLQQYQGSQSTSQHQRSTANWELFDGPLSPSDFPDGFRNHAQLFDCPLERHMIEEKGRCEP